MPSRFSLGNSTKAKARLLALRCVMARLCSISPWADVPRSEAEAVPPFDAALDFAADDRARADVSSAGAVRHVHPTNFRDPDSRAQDIGIPLPPFSCERKLPTERERRQQPLPP